MLLSFYYIIRGSISFFPKHIGIVKMQILAVFWTDKGIFTELVWRLSEFAFLVRFTSVAALFVFWRRYETDRQAWESCNSDGATAEIRAFGWCPHRICGHGRRRCCQTLRAAMQALPRCNWRGDNAPPVRRLYGTGREGISREKMRKGTGMAHLR